MKYVIIGTAGHVDHGKTALIKALTGTDTDRLKEEKARGISIDLGFASLSLSPDITAGVVDVPGHERFLKNMLAGTGGIDLVMLVIAADEGVMPQTREHLAMLSLYGVKSGVVVINKIDKVDADWLALVEEDIAAVLADTFLAAAPRLRVSAVTGEGVAELREALQAAAALQPARDSQAPFRLWVDRAFSVRGYGTVVTGSALSGTAAVGDSLRLYPSGSLVRIRGLEWHGSKCGQVYAGQRAAINVSGADGETVERGMVLSAPCRGQISDKWDIVADWRGEVASGTRIRLHLGTGEFLARVHYFKDCEPRFARLILESPLAAGLGDRGIIRLYSPQHLLGGATLVAPSANSRRLRPARRALAEALAGGDESAVLDAIVADFGQPVQGDDIRRASGYIKDATVSAILDALIAAGSIIRLGEHYLATNVLASLGERLTGVLSDCHREHPDRPGLAKEILRQRLGLKERAYEEILSYWQAQGVIAISGADVALKDFASRHSDWRQDLAARAEQVLDGSGLAGIDWQVIAEKMSLPADKARAAQDILVRQGILVRVGEILVYRKTIQYIAKLIQQHFADNPTLTVAQLRDLLNTSRKVALPLIEYLDLHKYTIRDGDNRRPGPKLRDLSE
ncbi:selenocysteine-specific translation elongation factor [Anaeroselena agilis]|uniref:Selenocysteine-specific elongation factor n=1 Tax=Anaeroselena agilis TaxID=3063788 RepID=A0ABU3P2S8_9FIRM|nr:selenocysteine-specific translation elongation factor [Selenomonadales bacterium 4137-cl]